MESQQEADAALVDKAHEAVQRSATDALLSSGFALLQRAALESVQYILAVMVTSSFNAHAL